MTRDELTTYVLERLGVGSSRTAFVTQIHGHLNRIYVREVGDLGLNMAESTLVFTGGDPVVQTPADFSRTETLRVGGRILIEKEQRELLALEASEAAGAAVGSGPSFFAYYPPQRFRVVPTPAADVTEGTLIYHAVPSLMDDGGDSPAAIPEEFHDLIAELTVAAMAANQEDPTQRNDALAAASLIRSELQRNAKLATGASSGRIRRRVYG